MLAVSEDRNAAQLMGVNVKATISIDICNRFRTCSNRRSSLSDLPDIDSIYRCYAWYQSIRSSCIWRYRIYPGAFIGGIVLGILEIFGKAYISSQVADAICFHVLIVVLLVKPTGCSGKNIQEKV